MAEDEDERFLDFAEVSGGEELIRIIWLWYTKWWLCRSQLDGSARRDVGWRMSNR